VDELVYGRFRIRDASWVGDEENLPVLLLFDVVYSFFESGTVIEEKACSVEVFVAGYDVVPLRHGVGFEDFALFPRGREPPFRICPDVRRRSYHDVDDSMGSRLVELRRLVGTWRSLVAHSAGGRVVAGSNPAVPTFAGSREALWAGGGTKGRKVLETLYLLLGIIGFMALIAAFFFGGFVILDFIFSRFGGDP
jgi:hypothetical protein